MTLGQKNYLFVGSEEGGKAAGIAYTLIETTKLIAVDPQAWFANTIARIPGYKIIKSMISCRGVGTDSGQFGRLPVCYLLTGSIELEFMASHHDDEPITPTDAPSNSPVRSTAAICATSTFATDRSTTVTAR